jgi:hypothetical protein
MKLHDVWTPSPKELVEMPSLGSVGTSKDATERSRGGKPSIDPASAFECHHSALELSTVHCFEEVQQIVFCPPDAQGVHDEHQPHRQLPASARV